MSLAETMPDLGSGGVLCVAMAALRCIVLCVSLQCAVGMPRSSKCARTHTHSVIKDGSPRRVVDIKRVAQVRQRRRRQLKHLS